MKRNSEFPKEIISTYECPKCETPMYLTSYAETTKWETVIHGIKCHCIKCKHVVTLTEKET